MTKHVHLMFAPCGVLVVSANPEAELEQATWEDRLDKLTCPACRHFVVRMVKSHQRARRRKEIDW